MYQDDGLITLLISCSDQPGIVAAVSRFIFEHQGNIIHSDQHSTDRHGGTFFMRISFAEDSFVLKEADLRRSFHAIAEKFEMSWSVHYSRQRKRAALFVSKLDHCLTDILWRWKSGELAMDIACVISNHQNLQHIAQMYGLPYYYVPIRREHRQEDQQRILELLTGEGEVDILILARYMQILEPFLVEAYPRRIINIHHSFLPAFVGANPYERAFERGVKIIGATAHYVTEELDEGPIIAQDIIHCTHRDTVEDLARKGREVERRVLAEAVRLHCEDRILVYKNKTIVF